MVFSPSGIDTEQMAQTVKISDVYIIYNTAIIVKGISTNLITETIYILKQHPHGKGNGAAGSYQQTNFGNRHGMWLWQSVPFYPDL